MTTANSLGAGILGSIDLSTSVLDTASPEFGELAASVVALTGAILLTDTPKIGYVVESAWLDGKNTTTAFIGWDSGKSASVLFDSLVEAEEVGVVQMTNFYTGETIRRVSRPEGETINKTADMG